MKMTRLFSTLFLGVILTAIFSTTLQAQKGKPQPPQPPANPAIAYTAPSNTPRWDLKVMDANGANQRVVVSKKFTDNVDADWSPDGKKLVFQRDDRVGTGDGLYTVNVDGTGLNRIRLSGTEPAWSPVELAGSYRIAFSGPVRSDDGQFHGDTDIFLVNEDDNADDADGTTLVQLTHTPGLRELDPEWSPSGDRLSVKTYDPDTGVSDVVIYRVDCIDLACSAENQGSVIFVPDSPLAGKDVSGGAWGKSHDILIVSAQTAADGSYDLWSITLGNPVSFEQLTNTPGASEHDVSWLPGDSQFAFVRGPEGWLWKSNYLPDPDGSRTPQLILTPQQAGISFFWAVKWRRNP